MPLRPCLGTPDHACRRLTARTDSRCPACAATAHRTRDAARGSRQQRGYDAEHQRIRDQLLIRLVPGTPCPRCGHGMWPDQKLDAGHPEDAPLRLDRRSRATRLEHAACNRGASD
jgi:hypothetical protein